MKNCNIDPICNRKDCFGCEDGKCVVLVKNNFGPNGCPFFKTKQQAEEEKKLYPQIHDNKYYKED